MKATMYTIAIDAPTKIGKYGLEMNPTPILTCMNKALAFQLQKQLEQSRNLLVIYDIIPASQYNAHIRIILQERELPEVNAI